jgi:hypothetical protein
LSRLSIPALSEALTFIQEKEKSLCLPPFIPREPLAPFSKLCQLACIWQMAGQEAAASCLASKLLSLSWKKPPFSLWCREDEYNEDEAFFSLGWLSQSAGELEKAEFYFSQVNGPVDPIIRQLAKEPIAISTEYELIPEGTYFTDQGSGTTCGVMNSGEVEIRAIGPQPLPLSGVEGFGILSGEDSWVSCFGSPEVWMERKKLGSEIHLKFIGARADNPLGFSFFVKADQCQVGSLLIQPKSLHRFHAPATHLQFRKGNSLLTLESLTSHKVQIIPLAGDGCFWNCEFLVCFEIHPMNSVFNFAINL